MVPLLPWWRTAAHLLNNHAVVRDLTQTEMHSLWLTGKVGISMTDDAILLTLKNNTEIHLFHC